MLIGINQFGHIFFLSSNLSAVPLLLLKQDHGQLGPGGQALETALDAAVVDVLAQVRVACWVRVLLVQCRLNCTEHMQA